MSIIKSFSVGNGDMFYIEHNSDNFSSIDCCYDNERNRDDDFSEIKEKADAKGITRFISTHPDNDHIKGIEEFCNMVGVVNFYCVKNKAIKEDENSDFKKYCELRDADKAYYVEKGCSRKWMNESDEKRGSAGINFLWPITSNKEFKEALEKVEEGSGYNNISPIFTYSLENGVKAMWMGDLEHSFLEKIKDEIKWAGIDILFAPHHGRASSKVPSDVLKKLAPRVIVIGEADSQALDYYNGYNTITQLSAKDITFDCVEEYVHVYVESSTYSVDFLEDKKVKNSSLGNYIGSFKCKER